MTDDHETERVARLVDHILRVAKPGAELYSETRYGVETEDTTSWVKTTNGGMEMWIDRVYPAMHRLPSELLRTYAPAEARDALIKVINDARIEWTKRGDANFMTDREKQWGSIL